MENKKYEKELELINTMMESEDPLYPNEELYKFIQWYDGLLQGDNCSEEDWMTIHDAINDTRIKTVLRYFRDNLTKYEATASNNLSLCFTHVDADAVGCAVVAQMMQHPNATVTVFSEAAFSNEMFITTIFLWKYIFGDPEDWVAADVYISAYTFDLCMRICGIEFGWYVDHHPTNQWISVFNVLSATFDTVDPEKTVYDIMKKKYEEGLLSLAENLFVHYPGRILVVDTAGKAIQSRECVFGTNYNEHVANVIRTVDDRPVLLRNTYVDDLLNVMDFGHRVSAALLLLFIAQEKVKNTLMYSNTITKMSNDRIMNASKAGYCSKVLTENIMDISQWDTFEWRDHPAYNHGNEFVITLAETFSSDFDILMTMLNTSVYNLDTCGIFTKELKNAGTYANIIVDRCVNYAVVNHVTVTLNDLLKGAGRIAADAQKLEFPKTFHIIEFPQNCNVSLMMHRLMDVLDEKAVDHEFAVITFSTNSSLVSIRSKSKIYNLGNFAKFFGGGGHPQAAGTRDIGLSKYIRNAYIEKMNK